MLDGAPSRSPEFGSLIAIHESARSGYRLYLACLIIAGVLLVGLALGGKVPLLFGLCAGVIALAVAIFPWRQATERSERISGLEVLREEWAELERDTRSVPADHDRLLELLWKLYDKKIAR